MNLFLSPHPDTTARRAPTAVADESRRAGNLDGEAFNRFASGVSMRVARVQA